MGASPFTPYGAVVGVGALPQDGQDAVTLAWEAARSYLNLGMPLQNLSQGLLRTQIAPLTQG